jgi:hypothetical protein
MRQRTTIRDKVCNGATKSALSWLAQCDNMNGPEKVDKLLIALNEIGATLNDFFLVLVFSYTDNLEDVFQQVQRVRSQLECVRPLHYEDVVDEEGQSIFVN